MTQNIEQRTLAATSTLELSAKIVDEIAHKDTEVVTPVGMRKSFPKISREWDEKSTELKQVWENDSATLREEWRNERNELSVKALGVKPWESGLSEENINQQRRWTDNNTYLPKTVPALMVAEGPDDNWIPYTADKSETLSDVFGRKPVDIAIGVVLTPDVANCYPKVYTFGKVWELNDASIPIEVVGFSETNDGLLCISLPDNRQVFASQVAAATREYTKKIASTSQKALSGGVKQIDLVRGHYGQYVDGVDRVSFDESYWYAWNLPSGIIINFTVNNDYGTATMTCQQSDGTEKDFEFVSPEINLKRQSSLITGWGATEDSDIGPIMQYMADVEGLSAIYIDLDKAKFSQFEWPSSLFNVSAKGRTLIQCVGNAASRIRTKKNIRVRDWYAFGFELIGVGSVGELDGWDLSGFSYGEAHQIRIRGMFRHNWKAIGDITPVNRQFSNNDFFHCTGNNAVSGSGLLIAASDQEQEANTANNWFGGEFAGNALDGINIDNKRAGVNSFHGVTAQGNGRYDYRDNGNNNSFKGYAEGNPKSILLDVNSKNSDTFVRSTYPLWNTIVNKGKSNKYGLIGSQSGDRLFSNSSLTDWVGNYPRGVIPSNAIFITPIRDTTAEHGFLMRCQWSNINQYLTIKLDSQKPEYYEGRTVTLGITYKNTNNISNVNLRVYAGFGDNFNTENGMFAVEAWQNALENFKTVYYDITFPEQYQSGEPVIKFFVNYNGEPYPNSVDIDQLIVLDGISTGMEPYRMSVVDTVYASGTEFLSDISSSVNSGYKVPGRHYLDTNKGNVWVSLGGEPSSPWKNLNDNSVITPHEKQ
jgi:hypothetical protein